MREKRPKMKFEDFCISDVSPICNYRYEVRLKGKALWWANDESSCKNFIYGFIEGTNRINQEALRRSMNMNVKE